MNETVQTWKQVGNGLDGSISYLLLGSNLLYAGWTKYENSVATGSGFSTWDGSEWRTLKTWTDRTLVARAVVMDQKKEHIYALFGSQAANLSDSLLKWDGSTWDDLGIPEGSKALADMATDSNGNFYLAGYFATADGTHHPIGIYKRTGTTWSPIPLPAETITFIYRVVIDPHNNIYMVCTQQQNSGRHQIYKGTIDGQSWRLIGEMVVNHDIALSVHVDHQEDFYIAGIFGDIGKSVAATSTPPTTREVKIAKYDHATDEWSTVDTLSARSVRALVTGHDGSLYLASSGMYNEDDQENKFYARLAKWENGRWHRVGSPLNSDVLAIVEDSVGTLYAGGLFDSSKSDAVKRVAMLESSLPYRAPRKIFASDAERCDYFGQAVAISGDTAVVGSRGEVYVFDRNQGGIGKWGEVKKLVATDAHSVFGHQVSISGDTIVVGVPYKNLDPSEAGAVYIFQQNHGGVDNWGQLKKLTASDSAPGDYFGYDVVIKDDLIVVGSPHTEENGKSNVGAAYVFSRNHGGADNWGELKKLTADDGAAEDQFGNSVAIDGDTIVVGAYRSDKDSRNADTGAAYIFSKNQGGTNNWGEVRKLTVSALKAKDFFGRAVAVSGDIVAVGASGDDSGGEDVGAVYLFKKDQGGAGKWGQIKRVQAQNHTTWDWFGGRLMLEDDTLVVSASGKDAQGHNAGEAYVYRRDKGGTDNWGEVQKLVASDASAYQHFGGSLDISNHTIIVGAWRDNDVTGAAYIFEHKDDATPVDSVTITGVTPPSPVSLNHGGWVQVNFDYVCTREGHSGIAAEPYTNGAFTPKGGYVPCGIEKGSGSGSSKFEVSSGNVTVDQIRIVMYRNVDGHTEYLFEKFIDVNYTYS